MDAVRKRFKSLGLNNNLQIVYSARKGIRPSVFYSFARAVKMTEQNLATLLHLHPRTIQNRRKQQKNLDPVESEHLLKLIALFARGEELFGSVDEFNNWLHKPSWNNKEKPIDLLITPGGTDIMSDELERLAHGYAV